MRRVAVTRRALLIRCSFERDPRMPNLRRGSIDAGATPFPRGTPAHDDQRPWRLARTSRGLQPVCPGALGNARPIGTNTRSRRKGSAWMHRASSAASTAWHDDLVDRSLRAISAEVSATIGESEHVGLACFTPASNVPRTSQRAEAPRKSTTSALPDDIETQHRAGPGERAMSGHPTRPDRRAPGSSAPARDDFLRAPREFGILRGRASH